jgi:hypothetical protein
MRKARAERGEARDRLIDFRDVTYAAEVSRPARRLATLGITDFG